MPARTIKQLAHDYFTRVNYVDIYGRNVGFDYDYILAEIKKEFPAAKTSKRWLRMMAYELNGSVRMPMRRRARRGLAEGYAMTLLLKTIRGGVIGSRLDNIVTAVRAKFPEQKFSLDDLRRLERHLKFQKFTVPPRP